MSGCVAEVYDLTLVTKCVKYMHHITEIKFVHSINWKLRFR